MSRLTKNCLHCNKEFQANLRDINKGNGKYCSISCSSAYRKGKTKIQEPNCECSFCSKLIYKSPSKLKISKSGFIFCSRTCKDQAQKIENLNIFRDMVPDHYGSSTDYRSICFRTKPMICEDCGYQEVSEILEVHHIDCNRDNNDITNLKVLCPTCHAITHFKTKTGKYQKNGGA